MRLLFISSFLIGLGNAQGLSSYFNTPVYVHLKMTNGYDSNVLRLSDGEKSSAAIEKEVLGLMETFDSHYLRGEFSGRSVINISRRKNLTLSGRAALIRYSHNPDKKYTSGKFEMKYRWGPYRSIKYSVRDLSNFYLRDYINKDVSSDGSIACLFSDRDQQVAVSYPVGRRKWVSLTGGYLQRYYNGEFSEFNSDIVYQKGRFSWKTPWNITLSAEVEAGKADNITFGETARSSALDRSYNYTQCYIPVKSSGSVWIFDEIGAAYRQENRMYIAESFDDPLHSGRAHTDRKLDAWVKKDIAETFSVKIMLRNRNRITHSEYSWVEGLKSFRQVQVWMEIGWRTVYDRY